MRVSRVVMKFGGSCLRNSESFRRVSDIVKEYSGHQIVLVPSALSGVTDQLIKAADKASRREDVKPGVDEILRKHLKVAGEAIRDGDIMRNVMESVERLCENLRGALGKVEREGLKQSILAFIEGFGEKFSSVILEGFLKDEGLNVKRVDAEEVILAFNNYLNALPLLEETAANVKEKIVPLLERGVIPIVPGFICKNVDGTPAVLGRGGSDFTATILAYGLKDDRSDVKVILWKDVDGLLTANPEYEENCRLIKTISYAEAKELAFFGAKLLHPLCLIPAERKGISLEIRNFWKAESEEYTTISSIVESRAEVVKAVSGIEKVTMITVEGEAMVSRPGTAAKLFTLMGEENVNIRMISQSSSENNITLVIDSADKEKAVEAIKRSDFFGSHWIKVNVEDDVGLLSVIGAGMKNTPGIAARVCSALGRKSINIRAIAQGSSELNITLVVSRKDLRDAVRAIHSEFQLGSEG
ncbi:MAG: aspartate kinase [Candidatus Freyarchaeota archaeon]|nr:aspartate kinase [Candidatus Freyrarchaeum guaymaensis]